MLSIRTMKVLRGAFADTKAADEVSAILNIVPIAGAKAAFNGSVISTLEAFAQFVGQVAGMTTDVTIDADVAGAAGNVTLTADSITDIDGLIAAHNLAFPANTLTLSAGDGSQVPTANIVLSGGVDEVSFTLTVEASLKGVAWNQTIVGDGVSDCATLIGAGYVISAGGASIPALGESVSISGGIDQVFAGGTLTDRSKKIIKIAFCDRRANDEFVALVQAGSGTMTFRTKQVFKVVMCDNAASNEIIALF